MNALHWLTCCADVFTQLLCTASLKLLERLKRCITRAEAERALAFLESSHTSDGSEPAAACLSCSCCWSASRITTRARQAVMELASPEPPHTSEHHLDVCLLTCVCPAAAAGAAQERHHAHGSRESTRAHRSGTAAAAAGQNPWAQHAAADQLPAQGQPTPATGRPGGHQGACLCLSNCSIWGFPADCERSHLRLPETLLGHCPYGAACTRRRAAGQSQLVKALVTVTGCFNILVLTRWQLTRYLVQALVAKYGGELDAQLLKQLLEELAVLVADTDLLLAAMALGTCTTLLLQQPSCAGSVASSVLPSALRLVQSQLLQVRIPLASFSRPAAGSVCYAAAATAHVCRLHGRNALCAWYRASCCMCQQNSSLGA